MAGEERVDRVGAHPGFHGAYARVELKQPPGLFHRLLVGIHHDAAPPELVREHTGVAAGAATSDLDERAVADASGAQERQDDAVLVMLRSETKPVNMERGRVWQRG